MRDCRARIGRIEKQLGTAGEDGPRTVADIVQWIGKREAAAGGKLTPEDRERAGYYWRRLIDEADAREAAAGRPGFGAKPSRRRR